MSNMKPRGQMKTFIDELSDEPTLNDCSNIVSLSGNEITNALLRISSDIRNGMPIDELFENVLKTIGESGLAERVLLFQVSEDHKKASLTHYWSSPYVNDVNPIGFQYDFDRVPLVKGMQSNGVFQLGHIDKYLSLPNYILKNKYKALLMRLKTQSFLLSTGTTKKVKIAINLHFSTREVVWSNEIEKLLQSVVDQLALDVEQYSEKRKKELLQKNLIKLQEKALSEKEDLLRQFASDVHDLPCSIIPSLRESIRQNDMERAEQLVDDLYTNLRQLINEYVVPDVDLLSFGSNLYQFINGFKKTFKGKVTVDFPDEEIDFSQKQSSELYKVIKEWLCNVEKHSESTEVKFKIIKLNDLYYLIEIFDNGIGFDPKDQKNIGYGLLNIRRRLMDINAKHEIKSRIGMGSTLRIQVGPS